MNKNRLSFAWPVTAISMACVLFLQPNTSYAQKQDGRKKERAEPISFQTSTVEWQIKEAPIRFRLSLWGQPTHQSAGYFTQLPDGGILPGPYPLTRVMDEKGTEFKSYVLWQNKETGVSIVFEDPGSAKEVYIYVTGANKLNIWHPKTGLTPSSILCSDPTQASIEAAKRLSNLGEVNAQVKYGQTPGNVKAPVSMGGDLWGRQPPCSLCLLSYLETTDPGKTWITPFTMIGRSNIRIDEQAILPAKRVGKSGGGTSAWINLSKGLHRLVVLAEVPDGNFFEQRRGVFYLSWKTPKMTIDDPGGPSSDKDPLAVDSKQKITPIPKEAMVRSGKCNIEEIGSRDGEIIAYYNVKAVESFWLKNTSPFLVYELSALTSTNPKDTKYTWSFPDGAKLAGSKILWPFKAKNEYKVTLKAVSGNKESRCTIPFFAYATIESSMDSSATKNNFRNALLNSLTAYQDKVDPTASWDENMLDCFNQVQEVGKGIDLLVEVMNNRWNSFRSKLTPDQQAVLENNYFQWIASSNPDKAIEWLKKQSESAQADKRKAFQLMLAEMYMYQKPNLKEAWQIVKPIASGGGELSTKASIRLGDISFLNTNLNDAVRFWNYVQNGVNLTEDLIDTKKTELQQPEPSKKGKGKNREKNKDNTPPQKEFVNPLLKSRANVAEWKKAAVLDTSMSSTVINLMDNGFYKEAYDKLQEWERFFPMSKLSSDYILQEADYYQKIGNLNRCRRLLEAYCNNIDATSYLPDVAEKLLDIMMSAKEPDSVILAFCEKMKKRFEFHPLAETMENMIKIIKGGKVENRDATIDSLEYWRSKKNTSTTKPPGNSK